jgi:hypothetical protein
MEDSMNRIAIAACLMLVIATPAFSQAPGSITDPGPPLSG